MVKRCFLGLTTFVCLLSLSLFVGCGDPENGEVPRLVRPGSTKSSDVIVIPPELYDTSNLTYDISDEAVQELWQLELPDKWFETKDPELHAKYLHAQLVQQFGNIPAVHIVAEHKRKRLLAPGGYSTTLDESINYAKARYVLWPNKANREYLDGFLKDKLMHETDDPELFAKIYREQLVHQFGDIPEVDIVVAGETKMMFGGFRIKGNEDEYLAYHEALYALFPSTLHLLESAREEVRKLKAEG